MKFITRTFAGILTAAALSTTMFAMPINSRFNVPFAFEVDGKTMPAGRYEVRFEGNATVLKSLDSTAGVFLSPSNSPAEGTGPKVRMEFSEYGGKHFLRKIYEGPATGKIRELPVSKNEKAVRAAAMQTQSESVEAGR